MAPAGITINFISNGTYYLNGIFHHFVFRSSFIFPWFRSECGGLGWRLCPFWRGNHGRYDNVSGWAASYEMLCSPVFINNPKCHSNGKGQGHYGILFLGKGSEVNNAWYADRTVKVAPSPTTATSNITGTGTHCAAQWIKRTATATADRKTNV